MKGSILAAGMLIAATVLGGAGNGELPHTTPDVVLYVGRYPGWPWVAAGRDGVLYCVFREGTVHGYSADGRVMFMRSADRGRSWTPARVIADAPKVDDRNAAVAVLSGGELLVTYNTYTAQKKSWAVAIRSKDGGATWSKPAPIGAAETRTRSAAIVLDDGSLLLPYYVAPGNGALAAVSTDAGRSWETSRVPDAPGFVGDEWDALEVEPGKIVGVFRNSHAKTDGTFWVSLSRDGGRTWDVPAPTNVRSRRYPAPPDLSMQGKAPTLIYADRRMVSVSAVTTSDPLFRRWDLGKRLPCYLYNVNGSPITDGGYPASARVGPRERLIVDYEIRGGSKRIAGYFVGFPGSWGRAAGPPRGRDARH